MGVTICGLDLEHTLADLEYGDVESAASEVVDGDGLLTFFVEAVGEGGGGWLVDDSEDFKTGDAAGVLGSLPLAVIEVSGDGDDGLGDGFTELGLGVFLELAENHCRDLGWRVRLARDLDMGVAVGGLYDLVGHELDVALYFDVAEFPAYHALDGEHRVVGIGDGLAFGGGANIAFAALGVYADHGWGRAGALCVFDDAGLARLHDGHARVSGPEIYSYYLCHFCSTSVASYGL